MIAESPRLSALVVDDEPVARIGLAAMVRAHSGFADVLECGDRESATRTIRSAKLDVVLLDIQLNPGTAFDIFDDVGEVAMPYTIFVTAFERFAIKAFEMSAIDYLLKPVDPERLGVALGRAASRVEQRGRADTAMRADTCVAETATYAPGIIAIADSARTLLFDPDEIIRIDGADYYAEVHARGRKWLVRETLDALEARLPCPPFFRLHRSSIANLRFVTEVTRTSRHRHAAIFRDGSRVAVSVERRVALEQWLQAHGARR